MNCPKCGEELEEEKTVALDFIKVKCNNMIRYLDGKKNWKSKPCGYEEYLRINKC